MISHAVVEKEMELGIPKIEPNQVWVIYGDNLEVLRKIRILAIHPDDGFIFQELRSKSFRKELEMSRIPEYNLRRLFDLKGMYNGEG